MERELGRDAVALLRTLADTTSGFVDRATTEVGERLGPRGKFSAGGGATGVAVGWILGGGAIGVVGLGMAIGIPVVLVTGILGAVIADFGYRDLLPLIQQWKATADRAGRVREIVGLFPTRRAGVSVLEGSTAHRDYLHCAIKRSEKWITIRSAFLSTYAVDAEFISWLDDALQRGVEILIEFGYQSLRETAEYRQDMQEAIRRLAELSDAHAKNGAGRLRLIKTPTHIKEVAIDDRELAIGSFNWLMNSSGKQELNSNKSVVIEHAEMAAAVRLAVHEAADKFWRGQKSGPAI
ncbi:MAG: hypothetical protein JSS08_08785 [Proteobacteria bacterium]|nr:hypothetical protein [Pseudomonadota bacterium]